jgi:hypothetical protein
MGAAMGMVMVMLAALLASLAPSASGLDRGEFPPGFLFGAATSAYQVGWCGAQLGVVSLYLFVQFQCRVHQASAVISGSRLRARTWRTARASATGMSSPTHGVRFLSPETSSHVPCLSLKTHVFRIELKLHNSLPRSVPASNSGSPELDWTVLY